MSNVPCVCCLFSHVRLCDPMTWSQPDSSLHGILQARIQVAMTSSRESSRPRDLTCASHGYCITGRFITNEPIVVKGFPGGASDKESGHKRHWYKGLYPGVGNGNSFQYFCLENSMDRGTWWAIVHGLHSVRHNWATERVCVCMEAHAHTNTHTCTLV